MNKYIRVILLVLLALFLTAGGVYWFTLNALDDIDMHLIEDNYIIDFEELNEKVYIKTKMWGLVGNHSEILLSTLPFNNTHEEYNKETQFVFINSTELYYQKKGVDSLLLYVDYKSEIPQKLTTKIKIKQIELKNFDEVKDYEVNYEKYGLSKISVYKDQ